MSEKSTAQHRTCRDPQLAVVTVTYSPGAYLDRFVASLAAATARRPHVVLADNGSTDGSPQDVARRYSTPSTAGGTTAELLPTGGNVGYGAAVNEAVRHLEASGFGPRDFLLLANPDVKLHPGSVDAMLECARRHPSAALIGPTILEPDGSPYPSAREVPRLGTGIGHAILGAVWPGNPWSRRYREARADEAGKERAVGWLSGSCLLLRWDAFRELGGFDERYFMYFEDTDLGDRAGRRGWENVMCPAAVVTHTKGHSADSERNGAITTAAHHSSAYRFMADRLPGLRWAPMRGVLWIALQARRCVVRLCRRQIFYSAVTGSRRRLFAAHRPNTDEGAPEHHA